MEALLNLIAAGDEDVILDKKHKVKNLKILLKNGLIVIRDKKLVLTNKGEMAKMENVDSYLNEFQLEKTECNYCKKMDNYIRAWDRKRKISITIWIVVLAIAIFLRFSVT